ncbi:MAG TPA: 16S rRNA (adenine(1518)-N(6)/adenine(1519)-N(6))-dimethyltransferase RsmA [Thermoanaerobaculia bacterium]|jgi:16S rRNA (adenine1518-N6/adenine1519-N6)-dimethyltransferase|nr:16S rRNA (adenine(1518)-N(6)/adenine(1519)-N(6))-dimethyltransferase RsmA [Thermoanaerobaculia bacterium]
MSHPKKKWGQHFLRNRGAVMRIVEAVEPEADDIVVEIGPGEGVLTEKLAELPNALVAVEIDPELSDRLRTQFGDRITLVNEDAIDAPLPARPYRAVGNLPYNAGTPILRRVVADPNCRRAVFMLQKEVADRLVAKPGDEAYGYLTLFVRLYSSARILLTLEPKSFYPPPKVRSAVVVLDPDRKPFVSDELIALISASFRMRRKKLVNNLLDLWTREEIVAAMTSAGIDEGVRAERLSLEDFAKLGRALAEISEPA